ncbi:MAG: aspartate ammonia-lyase [Candidatus Omnitrophica bacterium]|nr:aspartate ammonia-lyase [Candidatus Omnitrophota bacterium]
MEYRTEKDGLGEKKVPVDVYWGIHTQRALENFPLGGAKVRFTLIYALAMVKKAAAMTNRELGDLSEDKACAIIAACDEIREGKFNTQFPVDALQGGAGTSTNMNVNEVIANRANEILGGKKGDHAPVHPLDHVNRHQSTNDVYPTALKCASIGAVRELAEAAALLQGAFQRKEKAFAHIIKVGRTEMQEAVPMSLGAEFSAWAEAISRDRWRTFKCEERLRVVNLGGTAIGTGLGAPRDYIFLVIERLRDISGFGLCRGENATGETSNADAYAEVSGILKAHAVNLAKISNDLRLLNFLGEIRLPACQPGSSIMPGKVNPVIAEAVTQVALKVMANDLLVTEAASRSVLQINEFMPLLAMALLESIELLTAADRMLAVHIDGIEADEACCRHYFNRSRMIVTAFVPLIGYDRAGELLKDFDRCGRDDLRVFLTEKLGADLVDKTLSLENLMSLGYKK